MNNYQLEELENIRRSAKRGKRITEAGVTWDEEYDPGHPEALDCFVHILDLVQRIINNEDRSKSSTDTRRSG